jgi:Fis family transcriptional regulator
MAISSGVKNGSHKTNGNASRPSALSVNGSGGTLNGINGISAVNGNGVAAAPKPNGSAHAVTRGNPGRAGNAARARELPLRGHTERALQEYFASLNGHRPARLYDMVLHEVEEPLFRAVLDYAAGNQSRAAGILGINRGTLRKKLRALGLSE